MPQKKNFFPIFLGLFIISSLLFFLSRSGFITGVSGFLEQVFVPIQQSTFSIFNGSTSFTTSKSEVAKLREENSKLNAELVDKIKQDREIQALRDQFETQNPKSNILLPAKVVGMMGDNIIIDKGKNDGIKNGQIVVLRNNLIGKIAKTGTNISVIDLLTKETNIPAKTLKTGSVGIVKSSGGNLIFDNVDLSEKLEKDDLVITKGDMDSDGYGNPADLVIGKIVNINKKATNLFQSASVKSLVDFSNLEMVFIMIQ